MRNKMMTLLVSSALLVSLTGCSEGTSAYVSGVTENNVSEESKDSERKIVKLYYYDSQAENLIEVSKEITLKEGETLESAILKNLQLDSEDEEWFNVIDKCTTVNGVEVSGDTAVVDVSQKRLEGSSTEEMFFIEGIVSALTQIEGVEKVRFTLDGEEVETLMGHMDATLTYSKEDVMSPIIKGEKQ